MKNLSKVFSNRSFQYYPVVTRMATFDIDTDGATPAVSSHDTEAGTEAAEAATAEKLTSPTPSLSSLYPLYRQNFRPTILESREPEVVGKLAALENKLPRGERCSEWQVTTHFVDLGNAGDLKNDLSNNALFRKVECKSHGKRDECPMRLSNRKLGFNEGGADINSIRDNDDSTRDNDVNHNASVTVLQDLSASVISNTAALLGDRLAKFGEAVSSELPHLTVQLGADVKIRRTLGNHGGGEVTTVGNSSSGSVKSRSSSSSTAPDIVTLNPKYKPSHVHCRSFDGAILGFGLVSTKLGTPVYPNASSWNFKESPVQMFISQSKTGKSLGCELGSDPGIVGEVRRWRAENDNDLVVIPGGGAVAHSRPDAKLDFNQDPDPSIARWFCRCTLRLGIKSNCEEDVSGVGGGAESADEETGKKNPEGRGKSDTNSNLKSQTPNSKNQKSRQDRLALALLVAEHVWGDLDFVEAAKTFSEVKYKTWKQLEDEHVRRKKEGFYTGETIKFPLDDSSDTANMEESEAQGLRREEGTDNNQQSESHSGNNHEEQIQNKFIQVRHGRGRCLYPCGGVYEGQWVRGKKHGEGTWTWSGGIRKYQGSWENDEKHGAGTLWQAGNKNSNGFIFPGVFERGEPVDQEGFKRVVEDAKRICDTDV